MRAVSFTCFTLLCAVAFGIPDGTTYSDEITKVPEMELTQVTSESAARAAITAMSEAGKSDAKCRDMAKAAATDIEEQIKTDQKLMDALSTGSECAAHKKSNEIGAAAQALAQAQAAAVAAKQNADKAAKAPVKIGKIPMNKIGKNKCDAFFGSAYKTAVANLNAAKAAQTSADASVKAFKAAHVAATNEGSKRHQACLCSAQKASEAALKALNGKDRPKMEAEYKKAKMMICVLDGTNTGNAACSPTLGVVTPVALTADAKNAKCAAAAAAGNGNAPAGVNKWKNCVKGSGYGGITQVCGFEWTQHSGYYKIAWPIVKLSGTNIGSKTVSFHAGCGNTNGQDGCHAICRSLSNGATTMRKGWDVPCGRGYPAGSDAVAPKCVYKRGPVSSNKDDYSDNYGSSQSCGNPMNWCSCDGKLP